MIRVSNISKRFRSGRGVVKALTKVSFFLDMGKTMAVVGKSGSGKTTLLNCIGGIERPDSGMINCFGTEISNLSQKVLSQFQRQNIGFVFQTGNLLSYLSVGGNISFPLSLNKVNGIKRKRRVLELLEKIGLPEAFAAMPHELSGGELQRVSFARAIAHSPKMLLADEPTDSLDTDTARRLVMLMQDMGKDQDCTIILTSHDPEIVKLADETLRLLDGTVEGK